MSKRKSNFPARVLSHKKLRYQEGTEDDVKFMCSNGDVTVSIDTFILGCQNFGTR